MALSLSVPHVLDTMPLFAQVILAGLFVALGAWLYQNHRTNQPLPGFPLVYLPERGLGPKDSWVKYGREVLTKGLSTHNGPFQIMTGTGPKIVLPSRFADELKNDPRMDFSGATAKDFFSNYRGFECFNSQKNPGLIAEVVRVKLTQSLGLVTQHLVDETMAAVHDLYGEDPEWHSIPMKQKNLRLVARLSSRVFLGKPLCRNERWLEIARDYTVNVFLAARAMRLQNPLLRPFAQYFAKYNQIIIKQMKDAKSLIYKEVEKRKARAEKALAAGQKPPKIADTIGWMVEMARGREVNYVNGQLTLTMAAIHTTTEALTSCLMDICAHPEIIQPLRDEIVSVLGQEPWSKTALYKLKLMDSFLKENQRAHPGSMVSMHRLIKTPVTLSDGTVLPKGARSVVAARYFDPAVHPEPEKFDIYRFLRLRESNTKNMNSYQHVTTSSDFIAFGHGEHACPGRFFASNELKIALSHLLLKYDIKMDQEHPLSYTHVEGAKQTDLQARMMIRRRQEEVKLDYDYEVE